MKGRPRCVSVVGLCCLLAALLIAPASIRGREEPIEAQFKYAAGTESLHQGCEGNLELTSTGLTFRCPGGSITVPFSDITLMEYRNDVSRKIRKMKIPWRVKPNFVVPLLGGRRNRYFTVVFKTDGTARALVLRVSPDAMRPYLAEIDLKSAHRVEVRRYGD
ncbi:MAG: hypothetical protein HYS61_03160 [Acidobacteria bacterium]|nr:hypothetical protein [Acidobacteriota bacterium]